MQVRSGEKLLALVRKQNKHPKLHSSLPPRRYAKVRHFGDQSSLLFFCAFFPFLWGGFGLDAIV
jgi:hypothetical protein